MLILLTVLLVYIVVEITIRYINDMTRTVLTYIDKLTCTGEFCHRIFPLHPYATRFHKFMVIYYFHFLK